MEGGAYDRRRLSSEDESRGKPRVGRGSGREFWGLDDPDDGLAAERLRGRGIWRAPASLWSEQGPSGPGLKVVPIT